MTLITRILVPTDFSDCADSALTYALTLADRVGAAVCLVHAFDDPYELHIHSEHYVPMPAELRAGLIEDIRRQLKDRVAASGHSDVTTEVLTGPAAKAIVEGARARYCDLIVMGTHGRHGVAHVLLGSIAERVIRTAHCPVLVVRNTER
jgi:universal stress protein A